MHAVIAFEAGRGTLFNHEPSDYRCPFCSLVGGGETQVNSQRDVVRRTDLATALISPRWWPNNHGHVVVIPKAHHENLYDLPTEYGHAVQDVVREIAVAIRHTYGCAGTSTRQHNEPAGNQDAWRYHVHVFPRYDGDNLYTSMAYPQFVSSEERWPYAERLRGYFAPRRSVVDRELNP
jgi:histidine triad (HIT) family protein